MMSTLFDSSTLVTTLIPLGIRCIIDLIVVGAVMGGVYAGGRRGVTPARGEYLFTLTIFNILIFFLASLLADTRIELGLAFGLFAIFSILRYRTVQIEIREMTFLFISIIVAICNSMVTEGIPLVMIIFADVIIVCATWLFDHLWVRRALPSMTIRFENVVLVAQSRRDELIRVLSERIGMKVVSVRVLSINYLQDAADLHVVYENQ